MKGRPHFPKPSPIVARPNGRTATISRIIERLTSDLQRAPTDREVAELLAMSVARVRQHRRFLDGAAP